MRRPRKCPIVLLGFALTISGCASTANESMMSLSEHRLKERTDRFYTTVATGAVTGTVLGVLAGVALGGQLGAAAGIGALAGAGAGYYVAKRNESAGNRERAWNDRIEAASWEVHKYREIASAAQTVSAEQRATLAALDAEFRRGEISAAQYRREALNARFAQERIRKALDSARTVAAGLRDDLAIAPSWQERGLRRSQEELKELQQSLVESQASLAQALAGAPE
jgi:hypothetical protein